MNRPTFFKTAAAFRAWLEKHHATATELLLGIYKLDSGKGGITYKEALDEALCFGWIDGVRKRFDEESFTQRFTPRKTKSYWSAINLKRMGELIAAGRVAPAGAAAFERRPPSGTGKYSFEAAAAVFSPPFAAALAANRKASVFWAAQPAGYRKLMTFWVMSAKREETRATRLARLLEESAKGRRLGELSTKDSYVPATRKRARR